MSAGTLNSPRIGVTLESVPSGSGLILKYLVSGFTNLFVPGGFMKTSAHGTALIETDTCEVAGGTTRGITGVVEVASALGGGVSRGVCLQDRTAN